MKLPIFILSLILGLILIFPGFFALAQVLPSPSPVVDAVVSSPAAAPLVSGKLIAILLSAVVCLNIALSAVQQVFSALSQTEPGWLQTLSSFVLSVAKYLGSNPDTKPKQ